MFHLIYMIKYLNYLLILAFLVSCGGSDSSPDSAPADVVKSIVRAEREGEVEIDEDNVYKFDMKEPYTFNDQIDNFLIHNLDKEVLRNLIRITKPLENGKLECIQRKCTYTPNQDFFGVDTLEYTFDDPYFEENHEITQFKVQFLINPVNDPPITKNLDVAVTEDEPVQFVR